MGGPENGIKVFLRVRPTNRPSGFLDYLDNQEPGRVDINVPHDLRTEHVNNTRGHYKFKFDGVIKEDATQEDVFDVVARDAALNALEGFNATVFAYGQTGSGKTFTITGGAERYVDRGIIPRSLSMIFGEIERRTDMQITAHVSYLEIYNNNGYDLLDPSHEVKTCVEDLPRVSMMEDEDGNVHLKNLSMHMATSEEDALNLLFMGDTNRAISETAMNLQSSRSHCIFTICLEMRQHGSDVIRRSKLNLVDLAGSERVHKTNAGGKLLREAQFINSSLHYLEMVIVALHERKTKGRLHIPYRNSMMTSVLRDSLGGNCKTSMIATISAEKSNTEETISTCKFAQRVALVENDALVNEELDPTMLIKKLKSEVSSLKEEVAFLRGERDPNEAGAERIDSLEYKRLRAIIQDWVAAYQGQKEAKYEEDHDEDEEQDSEALDKLQPGPLTFERIHACFEILRELAAAGGSGGGGGGGPLASGYPAGTRDQEILQLKQQIQQRDNEIAILVNMVKERQGLAAQDDEPSHSFNREEQKMAEHIHKQPERQARPSGNGNSFPIPPSEVLADKQRAFEFFKGHYPHIRAINENKRILKEKYALAKQTAEQVNASRKEINRIKTEVEQIRTQNALQELVPGDDGDEAKSMDSLEKEKLEEIQHYKHTYKSNAESLRELKKEIERIQALLGNSRTKLQKEFENWYSVMLREGLSNDDDDHQSVPLLPTRKSKAPHKLDERVEAAPSVMASMPQNVKPAQTSILNPSLPLTGNQEADEDIMAFYKAKEQLMKRSKLK